MLTDAGLKKTIKKWSDTGKRHHVADSGGLYLIINAKGKTTWASRYVGPDGKRCWHQIGEYPAVTLAQAREKNGEIQEIAKRGTDPKNLEDGLGIDPTLEQVYKLFIKKSVDRKGNKLRQSTISGYSYIFDADILPFIGNRKIRELRKRDIIPVLEKVVDRGATNQANQVYRRLQRVMSFAAARDIIEFSPMTSMEPVGSTNRRSRILADEEVKTFLEWKPKSDEVLRILRLILITGARPGEVAGMSKKEIDGDWWTVPANRVKTGVPHRVFLTDMAKEFLPEDCFTVSRHSVSKCLNRAIDPAASLPVKRKRGGQPIPLPLQPFVPHDLRRTMATGLASLGFRDEVINAVQGRVKVGIIGTYNLYAYDKERQIAAEVWTNKLTAIITGGNADNVVPMTRNKTA
jgi:integrase